MGISGLESLMMFKILRERGEVLYSLFAIASLLVR